jgi:endonuclease
MLNEDKRPNWQFVADFVKQSDGPVTLKQLEEHLAAHGRNPVNARPDAACVSVNDNSRVHYASGRELRRTVPGNKYDLLFRRPDRTYVPYDSAKHGIWEIYQTESGTRGVRLVAEPSAVDDLDDAASPGPQPAPDASADVGNTFRLESHLRDYLAQNLSHFSFLNTSLSLYQEGGAMRGVEYQTAVGPIDILAVGSNGAFYVIELKVSRGADAAVGQVLRYMGAIRGGVAAGKPVYGVIVAASLTDRLRLALSEVQDKVFAVEYELQVLLRDVSAKPAGEEQAAPA